MLEVILPRLPKLMVKLLRQCVACPTHWSMTLLALLQWTLSKLTLQRLVAWLWVDSQKL